MRNGCVTEELGEEARCRIGGGPPGLAFGADSAPAPAIVFWGRAFARAVLLVRGQLGSQTARDHRPR